MATKLPTRQLGKNGPQVTAMGFGTMGLSTFYGQTASDEERFKILDRAYELGETNWDTSDAYGDSEDLLGKWFKRTGKRDEIFLASKFGITRVDGKRIVRNEPEYVRQACEKSLRRLGIDALDLYYCHRFTGEVPVEDIVSAMAELVKEGKVKHLGLSECSADTLRRAYAIHPISAVQVEYSPWTTDIESPSVNLLSTCRALGVAVVAYSPLGRGFLTGRFKSRADFEEGDFRLNNPRFTDENFPKNLELVDKIKAVADKKGVTSGQLTLAWLMKQGDDIIPIPGTKKIQYLEENLGSLKVKLDDNDEKEIRDIIQSAAVSGSRYADYGMEEAFRDTVPRK